MPAATTTQPTTRGPGGRRRCRRSLPWRWRGKLRRRWRGGGRSVRERVADRFAAAVVTRCRSQPVATPQATRCAGIDRYRTDRFAFVADPAVPPTTNAAERAVRPLVIARTISGGTRSKLGSATRMIRQSLVGTWDLRGLDPVAGFRDLLTAPAHPSPEIAPL